MPSGRRFASGLSGAPCIAQGGKPPQGVATINPIMHQKASEEGVHLYSPASSLKTLKRRLGSLQNDRAEAEPPPWRAPLGVGAFDAITTVELLKRQATEPPLWLLEDHE